MRNLKFDSWFTCRFRQSFITWMNFVLLAKNGKWSSTSSTIRDVSSVVVFAEKNEYEFFDCLMQTFKTYLQCFWLLQDLILNHSTAHWTRLSPHRNTLLWILRNSSRRRAFSRRDKKNGVNDCKTWHLAVKICTKIICWIYNYDFCIYGWNSRFKNLVCSIQ